MGCRKIIYSIKADWNWIAADMSSAVERARSTRNNKTLDRLVGNNIAIPGSIFRILKGQDAVLALHTGNNLTFSISGEDVRGKALDEGLDLSVSDRSIPAAAPVLQERLKSAVANKQFVMNSDAGYGMTVNIHMNFGKEYEDYYANLYQYNAKTGKFVYCGVFRVTKSGAAMFGITGGGEYLVTVTKEKPTEKVQALTLTNHSLGL